MKTSPIIIPDATLEHTQNIRKKFAKELAEREFFKADKLKKLEAQTPVGEGQNLHSAATYNEHDLTPFIQKCLEPLPVASITARKPGRPRLHMRTDENGKEVTKVLQSETDSLVGNGEVVA